MTWKRVYPAHTLPRSLSELYNAGFLEDMSAEDGRFPLFFLHKTGPDTGVGVLIRWGAKGRRGSKDWLPGGRKRFSVVSVSGEKRTSIYETNQPIEACRALINALPKKDFTPWPGWQKKER